MSAPIPRVPTSIGSATPLGLDDESLAACVQCGLCLPHCPTYRVTGDERRSPRGRISLMRAVEWEGMTPDSEWLDAMDTCVQCLGCVTACPSGVPYGDLIATTRVAVAQVRRPPLKLRAGLWWLGRPGLLRWGTTALAILQRLGILRLAPRTMTAALPARLPLRRPRLSAAGFPHRSEVAPPAGDPAEVVLFTGCVMDAWLPEVHGAAEEVLTAIGVTVERSGDRAGCCGALHGHAGLESEARRHAERVVSALTGDRPVLLDSAGCGAALKGYGTLLRTPEARAFADRVYDIQEWLAADGRLVALPPAGPETGPRESVIVQDPCHLRHAQACHGAVREVLAPHVDLVELDDEGLCCGAGGAFSLVQPGLAGDARDRKVAAVARATNRSGATTVVSANPGCALHLAAVGLHVRHPMEVLADACRSSETDSGSVKDQNEVSEHGR